MSLIRSLNQTHNALIGVWNWISGRIVHLKSKRRAQSAHVRGECLENRVLPVVTFSVTFDDPTSTYEAFYADLSKNLVAAGDYLASYLVGTANIEVVVRFSEGTPTANGGSATVTVIRTEGSTSIVQAGAASEVRTGVDPNGAEHDVNIIIGDAYLRDDLWLDPTPYSSLDPVPSTKVDGYSVLLHELVHAFGFIGYGSGTDGSIIGGFATLYDDFVIFEEGNLYFDGPNAKAVYGGPVPLTFGNHFHVGNSAPRPGSELLTDLMNGVIGYRGVRDVISALDLAILKDTMVPLVSGSGSNAAPEILAQTFRVAEHSPNGTIVGTVIATDPDLDQTRTFAITAGNEAGAFSIDPSSGVITVANGTILDIDIQPKYMLTVEVTDNGSTPMSASADMTIDLFTRTTPQVVTSGGVTKLGKGSQAVIDPEAGLVSDPSPMGTGGARLTVSIVAGAHPKDRVIVATSGDKSSRLKLKKGELRKGKTTLASATGGIGGTPLELRFSASSTTEDVDKLLKSLGLKSSRKNPGTKTISFQFYLEDGSTGVSATKDVEVS